MIMKKSSANTKRALRDRTRLEWILLAMLLLIALLLLASHYKWWPMNGDDDNLGTAFYVVSKNADKATGVDTSDGAGGGGSTNTGGGSGGGGNGGGSTTPPASGSSALLIFAAGVDSGNTKEQTSGQASGLNENCAVLVNSSTLGKQEVCTYTEGDKLITVTYLNDRVISASRSGF